MRPIDADQIIYTWARDPYGKEHDGVTLQSIIESMPTIELPDIIRCKDCKHYLYPLGCGHIDGMVTSHEDGFCSYAERREE